jgi:hypothetical protein
MRPHAPAREECSPDVSTDYTRGLSDYTHEPDLFWREGIMSSDPLHAFPYGTYSMCAIVGADDLDG